MARLVVHTAKQPHPVTTPKGDTVYVCLCGLSKNYPLCDGSHRKAADEQDGVIYIYNQDGERVDLSSESQIRRV
jgi:CDGSH-type Zn-finger protein